MYERKVFKKKITLGLPVTHSLIFLHTHTHTFYRHRQMQLSPCK